MAGLSFLIREPLAVSGFRLRARLGFSIPVSSPGPRGVTPAFGYGAPHSSTGGTSTPLSNALLSAHYARVRLLAGVPTRIVLLASRAGPLTGESSGCRRGLPVLARAVSRRAYGSWTTPGLMGTRDVASVNGASPLQALGQRPDCVSRSSIPRPPMPLSTLHPAPRGAQRKTRGQDGSLLLSCGALSSPPARRFIPTIALTDVRGSVGSMRYRAATVNGAVFTTGR
jgi:hypothetical protein